VLRANIGDQGILFDGFGGEYQVALQTISKKHATVTLLAHIDDDRTAPFISKIGLVMSRGERMDYAIQKSTELGATAIQLLSSHHGEVNLKPAQVEKKLAHWQQVAIAACEQCGLNRPPLILAPVSINDWLLKVADNNQEMAISPIVTALSQDTYYQRLQQPADLRMQLSVPALGQPAMPELLSVTLKQSVPYIELLIGPEGGLSDDECLKAAEVGFHPWQIGTRVLRTETAPVVALATLHALSH
jgi:16S rRNA (uracil1498-N3)-methyltransferase